MERRTLSHYRCSQALPDTNVARLQDACKLQWDEELVCDVHASCVARHPSFELAVVGTRHKPTGQRKRSRRPRNAECQHHARDAHDAHRCECLAIIS